jgi:hypothetical protein
MAIKLIANYAKRLGLPGYSSHQFSVSVEAELMDLGNIQGEAARIYGLLQDAVDREIQHVGFVPDEVYGMESNGAHSTATNGNRASSKDAPWKCSDKQKELILKLVADHGLDRREIDQLATERFGHGVKALNKLEASGLIDEIIETHGGGKRRINGHGNGSGGYSRSRVGKGGQS